jgi:hypothetical protein
MAGLIDTLLAYTTSRDAALNVRTVPLGPLVADVVTDRVGHPRPDGGPPPDVYVGRLPEVDADPAMLRHVLDNLIGNSLKYIQAGRAARIDVTAAPAAPGWARVEIADRGIGIPDQDKPNIFESFHRAETAAGYAGTGLGLAICRRIVERHGGAIGVADNPGGGTRFHFTLPLAGATPPARTVPTPPPEATMPEPYTVPDLEALAGIGADNDPEAADRAALERALAERAAVERSALPGLFALPAAGPSARQSSAARLQAPVPDHHHSA